MVSPLSCRKLHWPSFAHFIIRGVSTVFAVHQLVWNKLMLVFSVNKEFFSGVMQTLNYGNLLVGNLISIDTDIFKLFFADMISIFKQCILYFVFDLNHDHFFPLCIRLEMWYLLEGLAIGFVNYWSSWSDWYPIFGGSGEEQVSTHKCNNSTVWNSVFIWEMSLCSLWFFKISSSYKNILQNIHPVIFYSGLLNSVSSISTWWVLISQKWW